MFKLHIITLKGYLASVALCMVKSKKKKNLNNKIYPLNLI